MEFGWRHFPFLACILLLVRTSIAHDVQRDEIASFFQHRRVLKGMEST